MSLYVVVICNLYSIVHLLNKGSFISGFSSLITLRNKMVLENDEKTYQKSLN